MRKMCCAKAASPPLLLFGLLALVAGRLCGTLACMRDQIAWNCRLQSEATRQRQSSGTGPLDLLARRPASSASDCTNEESTGSCSTSSCSELLEEAVQTHQPGRDTTADGRPAMAAGLLRRHAHCSLSTADSDGLPQAWNKHCHTAYDLQCSPTLHCPHVLTARQSAALCSSWSVCSPACATCLTRLARSCCINSDRLAMPKPSP